MDNKTKKFTIKSSLPILNKSKNQVKSKHIIKPNLDFTPDYVLKVDLGLLKDFVNFNKFFDVATYDNNNTVTLRINIPFINNLLFNSIGYVKFDTLNANPSVVSNPAYLKLNSNPTNLNERFLEILII